MDKFRGKQLFSPHGLIEGSEKYTTSPVGNPYIDTVLDRISVKDIDIHGSSTLCGLSGLVNSQLANPLTLPKIRSTQAILRYPPLIWYIVAYGRRHNPFTRDEDRQMEPSLSTLLHELHDNTTLVFFILPIQFAFLKKIRP